MERPVKDLKPGQLSSRKYLKQLVLSNYEAKDGSESKESLEKIGNMCMSPKMDIKKFNEISKSELRPKNIEQLSNSRSRHKSVIRNPMSPKED